MLRFELVSLLLCFNYFSQEEKMSIIATVCSVGTVIMAVLFSLFMLKETFFSK